MRQWFDSTADTDLFTEEDCWVWVEDMLKTLWYTDPPEFPLLPSA